MARVELYTSMFCGYCHRAKKLFDAKGVTYEEVDVMFHPSKRQEMSARAGGRSSVPQIFIDGAHIGGSDELMRLEAEGRLDQLLGQGE